MAFGSVERKEQRWRNGEEKEEREIRLLGGEKQERIKNIYFFLTFCYSTILHLEVYCSTIAKIFALVRFSIV